jgi:hypothetical protein
MAKETLFKTIIPVAGFMSCLYWLFGSSQIVRLGLIVGWVLVVWLIILGLKNKWFN